MPVVGSIAQLVNRLRLTGAYAMGEPAPGGWPLELTIELTNRCDLACVMCPRNWSGRPVGDMDLALFRRIVDQAAGKVGLVDLCIAGESLLHPHVFEAIAHLRERGIASYLQTSGNPVDEATAERILDSGLDLLSFSIDGATPETYDAIRIGGDLGRVEQNLERFLELRARRGSRTPHTVVQLIVQKRNEHELAAFRARWAGSGIDAVRVKPLGVNRGHWRRIGDQIVRPASDEAPPPCIRSWRSVAIYWDGRAVPCCYDFDGCEPVGDLTRQTLEEVWRGAEMHALRERQAAGRYDEIPLCRDCNRKNLNVSRAIAAAGSAIGDPRAVLRALPALEKIGILP